MADIVLRNLEDEIKEKLRRRAASNQRSMNAEPREIVSAALAQPRSSSCCAKAETSEEMGDRCQRRRHVARPRARYAAGRSRRRR